jgi:hypothetical protein
MSSRKDVKAAFEAIRLYVNGNGSKSCGFRTAGESMERISQTFGAEDIMKRAILRSIAIAVVFASALTATGAGNVVFDMASILSGTFKGSTPGNDLRLDLRPVATDSQHLYDLFFECTGKYQGANVRRQGLLRLESQGPNVYLGYIPHFDATVSSLSPEATRFTDSEANAACGLVLSPHGDGFAGETPGASCAMALRGTLGKWAIELEPGSIRVREVKTGETLRFKRVSK